ALHTADEINSLPSVMHAAVAEERVIVTALRHVAPRDEPEVSKLHAVVVAKVVMTIARANPQVDEQVVRRHDTPRAIDPVRPGINGRREIDRGENLPAHRQAIIPKARQINKATRRPDPARRTPDPFRLIGRPVTSPPAITRVVIVPA